MKRQKYGNMKICKYICKKYKCETYKRLCKESKYIFQTIK